jgi:hypothetical protein
VEDLKEALRVATDVYRRGAMGGWLREYKAWFVEPLAWPMVRRRLAGLGHRLVNDPMPDEEEQAPPPRQPSEGEAGIRQPVDARGVVKRWFAECSLRWHPDRGGSTAAMMAINDARERLERLLGVG